MVRASSVQKAKKHPHLWSYISAVIFLIVLFLFFCVFAIPMGLANSLNTMMNTAYDLLINTVFYLVAITVLAGALSAVLTEFGVVNLLNKLLSPLMKPLYGLPGASALGVVTAYLSDNPAILTLAEQPSYRKHFKAYQLPALTNIGTSFGMGLIVTTSVLGFAIKGEGQIGLAALCGNLGAICGSILSTRLMLLFTKRALSGAPEPVYEAEPIDEEQDTGKKTFGLRLLDALMEGGKTGAKLGFGIIPGVLIICTFVIMLTNGPSVAGTYTGAAREGIAVLPWLANKIDFILKPLFGFSNAKAISVPVTALGSAGAALGLVGDLINTGKATCNDLAVFTAMCMCWSGYLSTHVSMMDALHYRKFTGKAILFHTFGGLFAGVCAHWLFELFAFLF